MFLTVHPSGSKLVADLVRASGGARVPGPAPTVKVDPHRRQIEVDVPHGAWNPGGGTVRLAMGVGLWNHSTGRYLLPGATASATQPGGAGTASNPPAFFNVAFRSNSQEPLPSVTAGSGALVDPRWWRDEAQGTALASGDISKFHADVSFAKLQKRVTDNSQIPTTGPINRILASHYEPAQGANFSSECGLRGRATRPRASPSTTVSSSRTPSTCRVAGRPPVAGA